MTGEQARARFNGSFQIDRVILHFADGGTLEFKGRKAHEFAILIDRPGPISAADMVNQFHRDQGKSIIAFGGNQVLSNAAHHGSATYSHEIKSNLTPNGVMQTPQGERRATGIDIRYVVTVTRAIDG